MSTFTHDHYFSKLWKILFQLKLDPKDKCTRYNHKKDPSERVKESEQENQNSSKKGSYLLTSLFPPSTSPQLEAFFVIAHGVSGESYIPTFERAGLKVMTPLIFIFITDNNVDTLSDLYPQVFNS